MKSFLIVAVVILLAAMAGTWTSGHRAQAQTHTPVIYPVSPQVMTLGMVGLGPGQTARLYALNLPGPALQASQNHSAPCNMTLSFMNDQGVTLGTSAATINPGAAAHLDLVHDSVTTGSGRIEIRGVVQQTTGIGAGTSTTIPVINTGCYVAPTLEIFDNVTGATTVVLETPKSAPSILPLMGTGTTAPMP